jgi:hypothetical protein
MIIALAGRRIDAHDAIVSRFPLENSAAVRESIRRLLVERKATVLVCAAACGADLLALDTAGELGIQRRIILPFEKQRFRATSVTDRPGEWGTLFDLIIGEVEASRNLVILNDESEDDTIFAITNRVILNEAQSLARQHPHHEGEPPENAILAVIVWEGQPRGEGDLTADFANEARVRGIPVIEIATR